MGTEAFMAASPALVRRLPATRQATRRTHSRAAEGCHPASLEHVTRHGEDIGAIVASCVSIVDPGFVVLGGGLGSSPLLLPTVREVANRLSYPVEVRTSVLGPDATVLGIEKFAAEQTVGLLTGDDRLC